MGPLVPTLLLVPAFLVLGYFLRSNPWLSGGVILVGVGIVVAYYWQFFGFANSDPDRLQSEEYRCEMKRLQMVSAKELSGPTPFDDLNLADPTFNPNNPMPAIEAVIRKDGGAE